MKKLCISKETLKRSLIGKITIVAGGTALSQIITMVATPIITRCVSASDYGIMNVFSSVISIITIASTLDYYRAIPIIGSDEDAISMVRICVNILAYVSIFLALFCLFGKKSFYTFCGVDSLYNYRFYVPIGVFAVGIFDILLQWIYRTREYGLIPKTRLLQSFIGNGVKLVSSLFHYGADGLILGLILSQTMGITTLFKRLKHYVGKNKKCLSKVQLIKMYYRFPLFSLPADFVDNFANNVPTLLLANMFGTDVSGYYGICCSVISIPINLIVVSISRVLYAEAASLGSSRPLEIKRLCNKTTSVLLIIMIIPAAILLIWGPALFAFVFGDEWSISGVYARATLGRNIAYCIALPLSRVLEIFAKQKYDLVISMCRALGLLSCIVLVNLYNLNDVSLVFGISTVNMVAYISFVIVVYKVLNKKIIEIREDRSR